MWYHVPFYPTRLLKEMGDSKKDVISDHANDHHHHQDDLVNSFLSFHFHFIFFPFANILIRLCSLELLGNEAIFLERKVHRQEEMQKNTKKVIRFLKSNFHKNSFIVS